MTTRLTTIPAKAGTTCVGDIDVVQLLRDIGEASAASSAVDLFGLCLSAQRVLSKVQAASAATSSLDEDALLVAYRALKVAHRGQIVRLAQILAADHSRVRPSLTIVQGRSK